jgi:hypothetical protein
MKKIMEYFISGALRHKVHLYHILGYMSNIYGRKNLQIASFYNNLKKESIKEHINKSIQIEIYRKFSSLALDDSSSDPSEIDDAYD